MNPFRSAVILAYAVGAMAVAIGWQLLEDTVRDIRDMQRAQQEMKGWWQR
jgi:hypothetical protein